MLTVSQLTYQIKHQLEGRFSSLVIQGEISNAKLNSSGHFYFDLKDCEAKIACVMFRSRLSPLPRLPKEGDKIIVKAALSLYPPQGKYQLLVESVEFQGVGALLLKLEELKNKLRERGWFEPQRKKKLPKFPKTIGVVTSPTGSVICDIIHVLKRRYKGFHLLLNPVKVQGEGAAQEIAQAIHQFNQYNLVEVIIVARGGGSLEDLWPFNEEVVASAIFHSTIPIVSAIGHETDFTIADFVADLRAPTPSAAAEIVTAEKIAQLQFLQKMEKTVQNTLLHQIAKYRTRIEGFRRHPLIKTPYLLIGHLLQKLDEKKKVLQALQPKIKIAHVKEQLVHFRKRVDNQHLTLINQKKESLCSLKRQFLSLNPKNVIKRGYSILFCQKNNSVIVSTKAVMLDDEVSALVADGTLRLQIKEIL